MARLVSSWCNGIQSVPKDYVMPPDRRAGHDYIGISKEIPVIDFQSDRSDVVQQIINACQEFGLFQVINHGVSDELMSDMKVLSDDFFNLPIEDKLDVYSDTFRKGCVLSTSGVYYEQEEAHYWKDTLKHPCHPLEEHTPSWPDKPARYKEVAGRYAIEVHKLGFEILDLIAEGLGLAKGYFDQVSQDQTMSINDYPPCPDPSLAMGIVSHHDINLITFLQQEQYGLQILKDGKWMGVDPIPNAFVVNPGYQLHVISNGKLKSAEHRVILSSTADRKSIVTFFGPNSEVPTVVEPAKELVTLANPQKFKSYWYNDFVAYYFSFMHKVPCIGSPYDNFRM